MNANEEKKILSLQSFVAEYCSNLVYKNYNLVQNRYYLRHEVLIACSIDVITKTLCLSFLFSPKA